MKFTDTLKKNHEFRRLYAKGQSAVSPFLVVYSRKTKRTSNRIGFTVSTKLGKAVTRNRVRRRLREIYRLHEEQFLPGMEIVVVARVRAADASYRQLERAILAVCRKLKLFREDL